MLAGRLCFLSSFLSRCVACSGTGGNGIWARNNEIHVYKTEKKNKWLKEKKLDSSIIGRYGHGYESSCNLTLTQRTLKLFCRLLLNTRITSTHKKTETLSRDYSWIFYENSHIYIIDYLTNVSEVASQADALTVSSSENPKSVYVGGYFWG